MPFPVALTREAYLQALAGSHPNFILEKTV
jgi:hypothetical protein